MPKNKRLTPESVLHTLRDGDILLSELTVDLQRLREKFDRLDDGHPYLSGNRQLRERMRSIDLQLSALSDSLSEFRAILPIRGLTTLDRLNRK